MPTLLLMRHALAADTAPGRRDLDRPLTEHGRRQASTVGEHLRTAGVDLVLCSPALRTRQTVAALALDVQVEVVGVLYEAGTVEVTDALAALTQPSVLVVGHAPAMPALAWDLAGPGSDPGAVALIGHRFPPATVARIDIEGSWVGRGTSRLVEVLLPDRR